MFGLSFLTNIPVGYFLSTLFKNEKGFIHGIKEIWAYIFIWNLRRATKGRHDFYDFENVVFDLEKLALRIPGKEFELEYRRPIKENETESIMFYGGSSSGASLLVQVTRNAKGLTSIWLKLKLENGVEYNLPHEQFYIEPKTGLESFVGGGLRIKCLIPMRRWRVSYNGLLKRVIDNEEKIVHAKFGFMCISSSSPQDPSTDVHIKSWARFLATESNWEGKIKEMQCQADRWIQSANLIGEVQIPEDNIEDMEVNLWGARRRSNTDKDKFIKKALSKEYFLYFRSGEFLHYCEITLPSASKKFHFAYIMNSTSLGGPVRYASHKTNANGNVTVTFTRGPLTRHCVVKKPEKTLHLNNGDNTETEMSLVEAVLDGDEIGHGVILEYNGKNTQPLSMPKIQLPALGKPKNSALVLPLTSFECRHSEVSGGKGSSLAELTILAKELGKNRGASHLSNQFSVPRGLVVTTAAYLKHVKETKLNDVIEPLESVSRASAGFGQRPLTQSIKNSIRENLISAFGNDVESIKFAVRSSASGEDSEELSAAGQMTTYLGVEGFNQIYNAVLKCWASQFSFVAIQYKRQNGQILNSPMAVVIQEMVPADVAGVMFTCDPVTGNPKQLSISANYGIGESVVSAAADPDTITIERNENGIVGVTKVDIGKKDIQIVMSDDGGVVEEKLSDELSSKSSLSVEDATLLAETGILVEKSYGLPVDMEWGFYNQKLYLLQARPITTFDKESEVELSHELDSPMRSEFEYYSTANAGEVMPGAFSPLGCVLIHSCFDTVLRWHLSPRGKYNLPTNPYFLRGKGRVQNHSLFNVFDGLLRFYHGEMNLVIEAAMISLLGRILEDENMFKKAAKRNAFYPPNSAIKQLSYIIHTDFVERGRLIIMHEEYYLTNNLSSLARAYLGLLPTNEIADMIFCNQIIKNNKKRAWNYKIDLSKSKDSYSAHQDLWLQFLEVAQNMVGLMTASIVSSFYNIFLLSILKAANKGWSSDVFKDFAYVNSSCYEVESVDVPNAIERLSEIIAKSTSAKSFKEMKKEDALKWLQTTGTEAGVAFKRFLELHGHRCYKEFDVMTKTWGDDPLGLVKTLQDMACVTEKKESKKPIGTYETMKNLSVPLSWFQKLLVLIAIPLCRKAVGMRERTKSIAIRCVDKCRKAYRELAQMMVKEGRLPEADLIFYLTNEEIDMLIKTRSPTLLQKAIRRRALLPKMDKLVFPEMSTGIIQPINYAKKVTHVGSLKLKGTPASNGVAEGIARVATSLEEASHLQPGEILIAYSTDIGWSPFFPMLAGVATELGGLVSHGAVVAREYGLPCVVAVPNATMMFNTGDRVLLNGNKGTLERIDETPTN